MVQMYPFWRKQAQLIEEIFQPLLNLLMLRPHFKRRKRCQGRGHRRCRRHK